MIDVYYWPTPNGRKVTIMLEECDLDYNIVPVNISMGDQFKVDFLRICPNNRMPAIVDHKPMGASGNSEPLALFESGAILEYLADKSGRFLASEGPERYRTLQWVHWQMANLGPMMGNANHFKNYAVDLADDPALLVYGRNRFVGEVDRLFGVMDAQLLAHEYIDGQDYSIADMICWPWVAIVGRVIDESFWSDFPNVKRWCDQIGLRPAVIAGNEAASELNRPRTAEEEKFRREQLFNQTNDKVRAAREAASR